MKLKKRKTVTPKLKSKAITESQQGSVLLQYHQLPRCVATAGAKQWINQVR